MAFINLSQLTKAVKGLVNKINSENYILSSKVGDLSDLDTTDKSNLVAAINEAMDSSSVTMTDTEVDAAVEAAFGYTITNQAPTHVSVQSSANAGETVIVTNISGSTLSEVCVDTTDNTNAVKRAYSVAPNGQFNFTMPDAPVTVYRVHGGGSND